MHGWMERGMGDRWMKECTHACMEGGMGGLIDGCMDGWKDRERGWMDECIEG